MGVACVEVKAMNPYLNDWGPRRAILLASAVPRRVAFPYTAFVYIEWSSSIFIPKTPIPEGIFSVPKIRRALNACRGRANQTDAVDPCASIGEGLADAAGGITT